MATLYLGNSNCVEFGMATVVSLSEFRMTTRWATGFRIRHGSHAPKDGGIRWVVLRNGYNRSLHRLDEPCGIFRMIPGTDMIRVRWSCRRFEIGGSADAGDRHGPLALAMTVGTFGWCFWFGWEVIGAGRWER